MYEGNRGTKLYHTTKKSTYENFIKKEGLKPICEREKKSYPPCEDWLYFSLDKNEAKYIAENIFSDSKEDWVELQVDLVDVLDKCKFLHKYEYESVNEVTATSKIGDIDLSNTVSPWTGQKFNCIVPNSRLKVVFDSSRK